MLPLPEPAACSLAQKAAARLKRRQVLVRIAARELQLDDATYRALLRNVGGVASSTDLTHVSVERVLAHLRNRGFKPKPPRTPTPGRPHNMDDQARGPLLGKVEALLLSADRDWAYADAMARQMFHVDKVAFLHEGQLHRLVAALEIDKRRRANRPSARE